MGNSTGRVIDAPPTDEQWADTERINWHEANPERVYKARVGWWIRPLNADGEVEYNTHPTAGGAARAIGEFASFREAVDAVMRL